MEFRVAIDDKGIAVVTSDPNAAVAEYGDADTVATGWTIRAFNSANGRFSAHCR